MQPNRSNSVCSLVANHLNPNFWRANAEEARFLAADLQDPEARRTMLQIAMMYRGMALRMQERFIEQQVAA